MVRRAESLLFLVVVLLGGCPADDVVTDSADEVGDSASDSTDSDDSDSDSTDSTDSTDSGSTDSDSTDSGSTDSDSDSTGSSDGDTTGDGDGDGLALVHVESDIQQALVWMDLSDPHPIDTAAVLLDGPYFPSEGHSDGRWAFARCEAGNDECDGVLFDIGVLPPTPFELELPIDEQLRAGAVSRDGSALIVR